MTDMTEREILVVLQRIEKKIGVEDIPILTQNAPEQCPGCGSGVMLDGAYIVCNRHCGFYVRRVEELTAMKSEREG